MKTTASLLRKAHRLEARARRLYSARTLAGSAQSIIAASCWKQAQQIRASL